MVLKVGNLFCAIYLYEATKFFFKFLCFLSCRKNIRMDNLRKNYFSTKMCYNIKILMVIKSSLLFIVLSKLKLFSCSQSIMILHF